MKKRIFNGLHITLPFKRELEKLLYLRNKKQILRKDKIFRIKIKYFCDEKEILLRPPSIPFKIAANETRCRFLKSV